MNQSPSIDRLFESGTYQEDLYSSALQWEVPEFFVLKRAIVISVKMGINTNDNTAAFLPQYSINARVIGEGSSTPTPENDIPEWYIPFIPNAIMAIPEIGEQILVIHETIKSNSRGYWIGRVNDSDKMAVIPLARDFMELGFNIIATDGTARLLIDNGVTTKPVFKVGEGRPNVVDAIKNAEVQLVVNTPLGAQSRFDEYEIGRCAIRNKIPVITTISGAQASVRGIRNMKADTIQYRSLQDVFN